MRSAPARAMTMALIWLEIWEMGILKLRESTMKAIRLPSVSRELPDETHSSPPTTANTAYCT